MDVVYTKGLFRVVAPLVIRRSYAAGPARVWRAWTQPGEVAQWYCPNPSLVTKARIDLQPGGMHHVDMGDAFLLRGRYSEVDREQRLAHTWSFNEGHETQVVVEFEARADGGSDVMLTHDGFEDDAERAGIEQGWEITLGRFEALVAGRE